MIRHWSTDASATHAPRLQKHNKNYITLRSSFTLRMRVQTCVEQTSSSASFGASVQNVVQFLAVVEHGPLHWVHVADGDGWEGQLAVVR